ncbi:hypothetical protein [Thalassospira australica]|uniref:hypothetical protein n=1 Tax=Thalassospira australica TaxID=1528106 RepID=UPI00051A5C8E|nr:hypothetical protein [Thalassospira australica]
MDSPNSLERNVFPRWRTLSKTPSVEIQSSKKQDLPKRPEERDPLFIAYYERWRDDPSLQNAAEVLDLAMSIDRPYLAIGPASTIAKSDRAMPAVKLLAEKLLSVSSTTSDPDEAVLPRRDEVGMEIRKCKRRLVEEPRNGLLWLEKGRLHTLIGDFESADLALRRAHGCAPDNRFIIRANARYLTHRGRADEALALLRRSERLKFDPWVQSVEIAVSEAMEMSPRSIRWARANLSSGKLAPEHLSELASAVGTLELHGGASKKAKRLFVQSLLVPTDNALSQALWARSEMHLKVEVQQSMLTMNGAFEARAQSAIENKNWNEAVLNCEKWACDEPYSIRAAVEGSWISSSFLWDQEKAIAFCDQGLISNPRSLILLNNKALSLARSGQLPEATRVLARAMSLYSSAHEDPFLHATQGLIAFRSGDIEEGRKLYTSSIEKAAEQKMFDAQFRAYCHWFYEEARSDTLRAETLQKIVSEIDGEVKRPYVRDLSKEIWSNLKTRMLAKEFGQQVVSDSATFPLLQINDNF